MASTVIAAGLWAAWMWSQQQVFDGLPNITTGRMVVFLFGAVWVPLTLVYNATNNTAEAAASETDASMCARPKGMETRSEYRLRSPVGRVGARFV